MTTYRERLHAGHYQPGNSEAEPEQPEPDEPDTPALPRTHADLDALAEERGHDWSSDDLTVAEKQAELNGL